MGASIRCLTGQMNGQLQQLQQDEHTFVSDTECLLLNLTPDLIEIDEVLVKVEELAPFSTIAGMWTS